MLKCLNGEGFIVDTAKNHNGNRRKCRLDLTESVQTMGVHKRQIQEHCIEWVLNKSTERTAQACDKVQSKLFIADLRKEFLRQASISFVVFYEENPDRSGSRHETVS